MPISILGLEPDVEAVIFGVISCLLIGCVILVLCFIMTQILIWHRKRQLRHKRRRQGLNDASAQDDRHQRQNRRRRGREFFFTKPSHGVIPFVSRNTGFSNEEIIDEETDDRRAEERAKISSDHSILYSNKAALITDRKNSETTTSPKKSSLKSKPDRGGRSYHNASPVTFKMNDEHQDNMV